MKKTYQLDDVKKKKERVLEAIKHDVRKYIKREKNKKLPEGFDFWNIDCKFSLNNEEAKTIDFTEITKNIDEASTSDAKSLYIELLSSAKKREVKKVEKSEEPEENNNNEEIIEDTKED